ncbi:MAG: DUF4314 domain-containing protein [Candidatus Thermoplasmatota archaeon]|nr:DUF4314 domain-containing protein [Candidatus Thermoplasmatota archaeon]MBU1940684.1 DUF4314 domain-containing protein [Candidatus Thermoplasmatota archaeon]
MTATNLKKGDRVELISWKDTLSKTIPGTQGTVLEVDVEQELIWVRWDTGEKLALLHGIDKYKKIS